MIPHSTFSTADAKRKRQRVPFHRSFSMEAILAVLWLQALGLACGQDDEAGIEMDNGGTSSNNSSSNSNSIHNDRQCDLNCPMDAPCTFGTADTSKHPKDIYGNSLILFPTNGGDASTNETNTSINGMHCACPPHWTGILCDQVYESCDEVQQENHQCYHGGRCISGITDLYGNSQYFCDCTKAQDSNGTKYVGKYCELPAISYCNPTTSFPEQKENELFCVNGGECNPEYHPTLDPTRCLCPDGYEGPHCEFESGTVPSCTKPCQNGGECILGLLDASELLSNDHNSNKFLSHLWTIQDINDHMQCQCPPGYGGPLCEVQKTKCGGTNSDMFCYHGSTCLSQFQTHSNGTTTTEFHCDCSTATTFTASSTVYYAGDYCQYPSTTFCLSNDLEHSTSNARSSAEQKDLFCVNGGHCNHENPQEGCICPEGYTGFKCEVDTRISATASTSNNDHPNDTMEGTSNQEIAIDLDDPTTTPCGDKYCYNGGECVRSSKNKDSSDQYCDCSTATYWTDGELEPIAYAGPYCQYRSTSFCMDDVDYQEVHFNDEFPFCVNGGKCNTHHPQECDCPVGWKGSHCEILITELDDTDTAAGDKPHQTIVECNNGLLCFHGGTCDTMNVVRKQDDGTVATYEEVYCDCSTAIDDHHLYAGTSCQHKSTQLCTHPVADGTSPSSSTSSSSLEGLVFCVNHGTCNINNVQEGCICPDGFDGFHCEYETNKNNNDSTPDNDPTLDLVDVCSDELICHHGGTCVYPTENQELQSPYCDCSTAVTDSGSYVGDTCQHVSTTFCSQSGGEHGVVTFCANGGTCNGHTGGCDCPSGWSGTYCDVAATMEELHAEATIKNNNAIVYDDMDLCNGRYCLNGGSCVTSRIVIDDDTTNPKVIEQEHCDCSAAISTTDLYEGEYCQYKSTSLCTQPSNDATSLEGVQFCVNGGTCSLDNVNLGCECSSAWSGFHCEYPISTQAILEEINQNEDQGGTTLNDHAVECGNGNYCYHGGTCILSPENEFVCDCSTATDATNRYAGQSCEYPSTTICPSLEHDSGDSENNTSFFCVNDGACRDNPEDGCHCRTGYGGTKCEIPLYPVSDWTEPISSNALPSDSFSSSSSPPPPASSTDPECHLSCQNGGSCAHGAKDFGNFSSVVEGLSSLNSTSHDDHFEHCVCQNGWTGIQCETEVQVCGDNEHICLHGSECVSNDDEQACDCTTADAPTAAGQDGLFLGTFCEHEATDICTVGDNYPGRPLYFCVNGGTCNDYVSGDAPNHPGCDCSSDQWEGLHCEIHVGSSTANLTKNDATDPPKKHTTFEVLGLSIITITMAFLLVAIAFWVKKSRHNMYYMDDEEFHSMNISGVAMRSPRPQRRRSSKNRFWDPNKKRPSLSDNKRSSFSNKKRSSFSSASISEMVLPFQDEYNPNNDAIQRRISSSFAGFNASFTLDPDDEPDGADESLLDGPSICLGPPRDEDGHELHNVEII